jgi:hypothetical protein
MVRFLVVEPIHSGSNLRFDMSVAYLQLFILSVVVDVSVDSEMLLIIDFVNLKIKSIQSFRCANRGKVCVRVFVSMSDRMCMSICVYSVFLILKPLVVKLILRHFHRCFYMSSPL